METEKPTDDSITFADLGIPAELVKAYEELGWSKPSPIQAAAIPIGLEGKDIIGQAQTGTGKTGAFGTIILSNIPAHSKTPGAIVLTPTRELAIQVAEELSTDRMAKYTGHKCIAIYGGTGYDKQIDALEEGADIIAGTPGRVLDLIDRGYLNLSSVKVVVMDESDRMLDMGFIEDVEEIFKACPADKQIMMFSATMPEDIRMLSNDYMRKPKEINVSQDVVVLDNIDQFYISVGRRNKSWALSRILDIDKPKALIFCQTIKMVDMLEERLTKYEYKVESLHGDMPQKKREKVVDDFREGKTDLLIATDVAARGIDIDDINYVINYDMPESVETYIHRIGRTGRAGRKGTAASFVTAQEEYLIKEFEIRTGLTINKRTVPDNDTGSKDTIRKVTDYDQLCDPFGMVRFEITLGKDDGVGKVKLADYIMKAGHIIDAAIGKIELGNDRSIVEVHKDFGNKMLMDVPKMTFRGKKVKVRAMERDE